MSKNKFQIYMCSYQEGSPVADAGNEHKCQCHEPEPQQHEDLLIEHVDHEHALNRVAMQVTHYFHLHQQNISSSFISFFNI